MMTLRQRIATALRGEMPDRIPFTVYRGMDDMGYLVERLRDDGMGVLDRRAPYRVKYDEVSVSSEVQGEGLDAERFITYSTPVGDLTQRSIREPGYGTWWPQDHFVRQPEDYAILEFVMRDATIVADYDGFNQAIEEVGEYGLVIPRAADPPALELWRRWTGLDRFCYDWHDCRSEIRRALDAMVEHNQAIFEAVAEAPSEFCCSGGNLTAAVVGPALFREEVLPHFEAEAEVMRAAGKRTVNHMDGPLGPLLECIADCPVDVVEAFAPFPDGDTTVAEAREAWPDKALSINFPSAVHLQPPEQVKAELFSILEQAAPGAGFVVGITENVPLNVRDDSIPAIVEGLAERGKCPLNGS
jgi:hypothetical protein